MHFGVSSSKNHGVLFCILSDKNIIYSVKFLVFIYLFIFGWRGKNIILAKNKDFDKF